MLRFRKLALLSALWFGTPSYAQTPQNVLIVVNDNSPVSRTVGEYYARRRQVPSENICRIRTTREQDVARAVYNAEVADPIARCLKSERLVESILYMVTTQDVPLRILGKDGVGGDAAAVD